MYPDEHFVEKPVKEAMAKFRKNLDEIVSIITERNKNKKLPYYYLSPDRIPNSVAVWAHSQQGLKACKVNDVFLLYASSISFSETDKKPTLSIRACLSLFELSKWIWLWPILQTKSNWQPSRSNLLQIYFSWIFKVILGSIDMFLLSFPLLVKTM